MRDLSRPLKTWHKTTFLLPEPRDKLLGRDGADFLLLRGDRVEEVGEAGEKRLLAPLVLRLVLQHLVAERLAEVEGLQHRVGVAGVAKLKGARSHF